MSLAGYSRQLNIPIENYQLSLDKARIKSQGNDITVVAYGDGFQAALEALELVEDISVELIDLVSIKLMRIQLGTLCLKHVASLLWTLQTLH